MSYQIARVRSKRTREQVFGEDGWKCAYCLLDLTTVPRAYVTVDHVLPRSAGGSNDVTNLLTSCHMCNSRRRDTPITDFVGAETMVRLLRDYPRVARTIVETMTKVQRAQVRMVA